MTLSWSEFLARRDRQNIQYFPYPGATRTVMVCSHIWWTEQIALAFHNCGYNLLLHPPLYLAYTDETAFAELEQVWPQILHTMQTAKVDYLVGGNTSALLVHPYTGELLHEAARAQGRPVTLINWWWDEVRTRPPLARAGVGPAGFVKLLANEHTVNAIWDIDVMEELEAQFGLKNLVHLPLATLPEFWPHGYVPLEERPLAACFLGHCHFAAEWTQTDPDPLCGWARSIVRRKIANPQTPMQTLIESAYQALRMQPPVLSADSADEAWQVFSRPSEVLNATYMHETRNVFVQAAKRHIGGKLALIGKGWEKLGLHANMEHAGDKSGVIYGQSQVCLNLFGGCVHGGLPLRPYDIGASGGLIVTHDQRELPGLFEPGKECLAFQCVGEMAAIIEKVRKAPAEFNEIARAGRRRVLAEHTWGQRIKRLMSQVGG